MEEKRKSLISIFMYPLAIWAITIRGQLPKAENISLGTAC